jgi:hypothetical protein
MTNPNKEQYFLSEQKYICFSDIMPECTSTDVEYQNIPHAIPRKDFNQHQILTVLLFKGYIGFRYRDFAELVEIMGLNGSNVSNQSYQKGNKYLVKALDIHIWMFKESDYLNIGGYYGFQRLGKNRFTR